MSNTNLHRHERVLKKIIDDLFIPAPQIKEALKYCLSSGGKRIRPMLVYATGTLFNIKIEILDYIAAAIELTHCYSLIHDDLPAMDNDDLRRGKPSCHKAFDEATAILIGDGLQALALEILLTYLPQWLSPLQTINMTTLLTKASGLSGMVSGQSLDLTELTNPRITTQELERIHLLKTGQLITVCCTMVLAASDWVPKAFEYALKTYSHHLGLVFQIQDDYLDCYAPVNKLGKSRSSDTANNKKTFATLFNKQQLEHQIIHHYEQAFHALNIFPHPNELYTLTQSLQQRSVLPINN